MYIEKYMEKSQNLFTNSVECAILLWYEILAYAQFQDTPSVT